MTSSANNRGHKLSQRAFYGEYHGHRIVDLQAVLAHIRDSKPDGSRIIYLAGDSSLDNKYWFSDTAPAVNAYEDILDPATSVQVRVISTSLMQLEMWK